MTITEREVAQVEACPALTLLEMGDGTWGVTLQLYLPLNGRVASIIIFETQEDAHAFIAMSEQNVRKRRDG